jgi:hypothetical protein
MNTLVSPGLVSVPAQRGELLRLAIRLDAWISGAFGIAMLVGSDLLMHAVGAPSTFLWAVNGCASSMPTSCSCCRRGGPLHDGLPGPLSLQTRCGLF